MDLFHYGLLIYYVLVSSSSILVVKFTEAPGGRVEYNVTTTVVAAEMLKLAAAWLFDRVWYSKAGEKAMQPRSSWPDYFRYAVPSLIYAVQNNLLTYGISLLGPSLFSLLGNFKIVATTLLTSVVLSKNFTKIQWISVLLLVLSFFVAKVQLLMGPPASAPVVPIATGADAGAIAEMGRFTKGVLVVIMLSLLSGSAAISNEYLLKNVDPHVSFMRKNVWTYQWGVLMNVLYLVFKMQRAESTSMFHGYSVSVGFLIVINAMLGLSVSMIMKYFDNVTKCFASSLVVYLTAAFEYFYLSAHTVDGPFMLAVVIFSIASFLYMGSHNDELPKIIITDGLARCGIILPKMRIAPVE